MVISFYGNSDKGKIRAHNEDSLLILSACDGGWDTSHEGTTNTDSGLGAMFVVADGMGGANAGEVASALAIKTVHEEVRLYKDFPEREQDIRNMLNQIILRAHEAIVDRSMKERGMEGMGTTIVLSWIVRNSIYSCWSGDSRCYLFTASTAQVLQPFTDDHSLVWQQQVLLGQMTAEEARLSPFSNLILQSLGDVGQIPSPGFKSQKLNTPGRILMCSDGLNSMLSDQEIHDILNLRLPTRETVNQLINAANTHGGRDNITVILIDH